MTRAPPQLSQLRNVLLKQSAERTAPAPRLAVLPEVRGAPVGSCEGGTRDAGRTRRRRPRGDGGARLQPPRLAPRQASGRAPHDGVPIAGIIGPLRTLSVLLLVCMVALLLITASAQADKLPSGGPRANASRVAGEREPRRACREHPTQAEPSRRQALRARLVGLRLGGPARLLRREAVLEFGSLDALLHGPREHTRVRATQPALRDVFNKGLDWAGYRGRATAIRGGASAPRATRVRPSGGDAVRRHRGAAPQPQPELDHGRV